MQPDHKAVFIVGMTRSGSTLMLRLLASHSQLVGVGETFILKRFAAADQPAVEFARSITRSPEEYAIARDHLEKIFGATTLRNIDPYQFLDEYCRAFCLYFRRAGYVEKTNVNSFFIEGVLKNIPQARIIVTVRDPRAVLASKLHADKVCRGKRLHLPRRMQFYLNLSEILFTYQWQARFYAPLYRDRVLFVKYEDLVSDSPAALRQMFAFIGVPYEPVHENINPFDLSIARRSFSDLMNSSFGTRRTKSISPESLSRWKTIFSKEEIDFVKACCARQSLQYVADFYPDMACPAATLAAAAMALFSKIDAFGYIRKNIKTPSLVSRQ